ncbi:MAG: glycosyltransferase family 2 protein [Acidobacteria bacterium]|nr:glycosyltransferase family 2 protein [Acidobacteriota bacterium]MCA1640388.1 glycosyltransferase family 2 protein [Acidobacteriota bacterium]
MSTPSVHVIILNWNGLPDTLECLAALRRQDYPALKVWVVDNGSAEVEAETVRREYPEVEVLPQGANLGFCGGNNVGIRSALDAGADYVLVLNNDTVSPPNFVSDLIAQSARLERVGAVSPLILRHPEEDLIWYAGAAWEPETAGFRHLLEDQPRTELRAREPYPTTYACGCCLLVPATVLRRVGLMDERYFAYYDEADWCARMKNAGFECYVVPTVSISHKVSRSTPGLISAYLMARNRLLWMRENLPRRERWRSARYLVKEFVWNALNAAGLPPGGRHISSLHSRVMLLAWRDFLLRRFGGFPDSVARLANPTAKAARTE